jgi:ubiquinone/menaquinone biosynthesis C-methylase UbiE
MTRMPEPQAGPLASPMPWNLVASAYEREVMPMFEAYAKEALRFAAPAAGARLVDVACGPGTLAVLAAERGYLVDAIDFAPAMIERLEARRAPGVTARLGDGQQLPYADGTFAAGFSMFGLMFFPDRARGFRELRRVLAPGARAVVSSWIPLDEVPVMRAMFEGVSRGLGQPRAVLPTPLGTADAYRDEMGAAFADVEVHRVSTTHNEPSAREMWGMMERTLTPLLVMRKNVGEQRWQRVQVEATMALERLAGGGHCELTMTALMGVGVAR